MSQQQYVIFTIGDARFAIEATSVQEIVALPELTPIAEAPPHIAGLANVRGAVVPVIDLAVRLGMPSQAYSISDSVILFDHANGRFGIIINDVHEVRSIDTASIRPVPLYGGSLAVGPRFIEGIADSESGLLAVLALDSLVRVTGDLDSAAAGTPALPANAPRNLPDLPAADLAVLRRRAESLMQRVAADDVAGHLLLALFRLGDEYFGAKLDVIREFTEIVDPTRVPCSPDHIIGQMNLRGEILTLVDVRPALRMALAKPGPKSKVIVLANADLHAGVVADEVIDVIAVAPDSIMPVPAAMQQPVDEYIRGVANYGDRVVAILDLAVIFERGELDVEEE